ncbi:MAG TPA: DUF4145 domain-containing protein [Nostoc sp. UBA8866]|uniref:DUF4145 domain-containing protein n=2 Tax=Nostocaceae TaxID=1162 RepID=A0A1Z4KU17_ANAVA|nr:DUF4145 domain-containing protein [Nostoc sp. PCC 7120 = FACHB-418]BAB73400.1 alr1443 [Nostoc sp. PCC 7120 = FACHB-418]BAY72418.1 hypothetical protein NIES23_52430 [Trichormus variabilis NIES-23]HBW32883.1 DUF4145 domain-containing protein [Nostoc sp. UBA8866]
MSTVGIFGGRGTSEESHLQNARCQYMVLDEVDVAITNEYRRFKFLIFPSRLFTFARICANAINNNIAFPTCMERFLERGGRILFCPPSQLPTDYWYHEERTCLLINWLPVGTLKLHQGSRRKQTVSIQVQQPDHPICNDLTGKEKVDLYSYFSFEGILNAEVLISSRRGTPLITTIPFGAGFVLVSAIDLPFLHPDFPSSDATSLFHNILHWGQEVPSIAVTFNSLVTRVLTHVGSHEAHLMERADQAILACRYSEACDYAFRAFERILRFKAGSTKTLNDAIDQLFPKTSSQNSFCHGVRITRNASAHGTRLPEEVTIEETECLFSSIKFILSGLLADP